MDVIQNTYYTYYRKYTQFYATRKHCMKQSNYFTLPSETSLRAKHDPKGPTETRFEVAVIWIDGILFTVEYGKGSPKLSLKAPAFELMAYYLASNTALQQ